MSVEAWGPHKVSEQGKRYHSGAQILWQDGCRRRSPRPCVRRPPPPPPPGLYRIRAVGGWLSRPLPVLSAARLRLRLRLRVGHHVRNQIQPGSLSTHSGVTHGRRDTAQSPDMCDTHIPHTFGTTHRKHNRSVSHKSQLWENHTLGWPGAACARYSLIYAHSAFLFPCVRELRYVRQF